MLLYLRTSKELSVGVLIMHILAIILLTFYSISYHNCFDFKIIQRTFTPFYSQFQDGCVQAPFLQGLGAPRQNSSTRTKMKITSRVQKQSIEEEHLHLLQTTRAEDKRARRGLRSNDRATLQSTPPISRPPKPAAALGFSP